MDRGYYGLYFITHHVFFAFFTYSLKNGNGYTQEVSHLIGQDFVNKASNTPVGGGSVGAIIYQLLFTLMSNIGTWIVSIILLFAGIVFFPYSCA